MTTAIPAPCEAAVIKQAAASHAEHGFGILLTTVLGSSVAFIDGSVVNVALPAMQTSLALPEPAVQWIVNAYLLPLSALLLLGGASGDRFGQRRVFVLGLLLFGVSSAACAVAQGTAVLLAGRAVQGIAAALMVPTSLAILGSCFDARERGKAIGTWAAASAVAGAVGPVLGGWLVDAFSWRAIFLINPPIVLVTVMLAMRYLAGPAPAAPAQERDSSIDWAGSALITASLGLLSWGLIELGAGTHTSLAWTAVAASLVLAAAFIALEHKLGTRAMMPLRLFRSATFSAVNGLTLLLYGALAGLMLLLPFLLIRVAGWNAMQSGAALLPLPVLIGLLSRAAGRWSEQFGARRFLTFGPLLVAAGMLLLLRLDADHVEFAVDVLPALCVISLGMALTVAPLTATVIAAVDPGRAGIASGINNAIARIAALIAGAMVGPVLMQAQHAEAFVSAMHGAAAASAGAVAAGATITAWIISRHQPAGGRK